MLVDFSKEEKIFLKRILKHSLRSKKEIYLVGGILRDLFLRRKKDNPDFDFVLKTGAISFAKSLALELKGGFVILDKENGACRIVKKQNAKVYTFDFTDYRARNLLEDLKKRDFTINAMALKLEDVFKEEDFLTKVFDPYGARKDMARKVIRIVNKDAFKDDPLRILRAFSLASSLGFKIEPLTLKLAKKESRRLSSVSSERIRDELFKIFLSERSYENILLLDKNKILEVIFPEIKKMRGIGQGPYHHLDVWEHTLETLKQLDALLINIKDREINSYLNEVISSDRRRKQLLKLAALLHDVGKPATLRKKDGKTIFHGHERVGVRMVEEIAQRLKLSNAEIHSLHKMILWHLRPGYLADFKEPTARAKFRYFRDAGIEALSILLLSLADQRATKGPLTTASARRQHEKVVGNLIQEYLQKQKEKKPQRLVDGFKVMRFFRLKPSPLVGKILSWIEEQQGIGKIKTKEEALLKAKKFFKL